MLRLDDFSPVDAQEQVAADINFVEIDARMPMLRDNRVRITDRELNLEMLIPVKGQKRNILISCDSVDWRHGELISVRAPPVQEAVKRVVALVWVYWIHTIVVALARGLWPWLDC